MKHWRYSNLVWHYEKRAWDWLRKKQPIKHICEVRGCTNAAPLRWRNKKLVREEICDKCKRRRWRYNNPVYYMFSELRKSAKKRKISFDLHYGEFLEFCFSNDFYRISPKFTKDSLTVDRIEPEKGYSIDNIQVVTQSVNAQNNRKYQMRYKSLVDSVIAASNDIDEPF